MLDTIVTAVLLLPIMAIPIVLIIDLFMSDPDELFKK